MGIFSKSSKFEYKLIPSTPEQTAARSYLEGLYQQDIVHPEQQVAELSDSERAIQGQVGSYLTGSQGNYDTASSYFQDVLSDEYNPEESRYYQGLRSQIDRQKGEAQAGVRRTAQKAGSARSTPYLGIEAQTGQRYDEAKDVALGGLLQDERQFKAQAGQSLSNLDSQRVSQLGAADQIASKEREIEQMKFNAAYQKIINDLLAPYQYQANIASALLNEVRYQGVQSGGGMTDLGFVTSAAIQGFEGAAKAKMAAG